MKPVLFDHPSLLVPIQAHPNLTQASAAQHFHCAFSTMHSGTLTSTKSSAFSIFSLNASFPFLL